MADGCIVRDHDHALDSPHLPLIIIIIMHRLQNWRYIQMSHNGQDTKMIKSTAVRACSMKVNEGSGTLI